MHIIRTHYPGIREREILSWNWDQVGDVCRRIDEDRREQRRWDLYARISAAITGAGGDTELFDQLVRATYTEEDNRRRYEAEEAEQMKRLEEDRRARTQMMRAAREAMRQKRQEAQPAPLPSHDTATDTDTGTPVEQPANTESAETPTPTTPTTPRQPRRRLMTG